MSIGGFFSSGLPANRRSDRLCVDGYAAVFVLWSPCGGILRLDARAGDFVFVVYVGPCVLTIAAVSGGQG